MKWVWNSLAVIVFIVVSPIGDAVNGYLKSSDDSCWPAGALGGGRVMLVCPGVFVNGTIMGYSAPRLARAGCVNEFIQGARAQFELKWVMLTSGHLRAYVSGRVDGRLMVDVIADGVPVHHRMVALGTARDPLPAGENPWCE